MSVWGRNKIKSNVKYVCESEGVYVCARKHSHVVVVHTAGRSRYRGSGELGHPDQHRAALSSTTFYFLEEKKN